MRWGRASLFLQTNHLNVASVYANNYRDILLENLLIIRKLLIHKYIKKTEMAKGTNWEQKIQNPQNENICLTNLNVENK